MSKEYRPKDRKPLPPGLGDQADAAPIGACFGYVRFAGDDASNGARQQSSIKVYAATLGVEVAGWHEDGPARHGGVMGPGLRNLLVAARSGEFTDLVVEGPDRLTRDYHLMTIILDVLEGAGIRLHDAGESRVCVRQDEHMGTRARLALLDRRRRSMMIAAGRRRRIRPRALPPGGPTAE